MLAVLIKSRETTFVALEPLVSVLGSVLPFALDRLRGPLVWRLASLLKACGTVECPFWVLLPDGIYLRLDLVSTTEPCWSIDHSTRPQGWPIMISMNTVMIHREAKGISSVSSCKLVFQRAVSFGHLVFLQNAIVALLEGRNRSSWVSPCNRPSGLSAWLSAAAIVITCMKESTGGVLHEALHSSKR